MRKEGSGRPRKYSSLKIRRTYIKCRGDYREMGKAWGTSYEVVRKIMNLRRLRETFPSISSNNYNDWDYILLKILIGA